jgi:hypothetical protein
VSAPRLTALGAAQQEQLELIEEARAIANVAGDDGPLWVERPRAMVRALVEALDSLGEDYARRDALLDSKDVQLNELHDLLSARLDDQHEENLRMLLVFFALGRPTAKTFDAEELQALLDDLSAVLGEIKALRATNAQVQADLRTMRDENLVTERALTAEREKTAGAIAALAEANDRLAAASKEVEHLYLTASLDMDRKIAVFNGVVGLRQLLDPSTMIGDGGDYVIINAPRTVAAGA